MEYSPIFTEYGCMSIAKKRSKTSACTGKNPETNCLIFVIMLTTFFVLSPEVS